MKTMLFALVLLGALLGSARAEDRDVVINEIMYHPPDDLDNLQFIELFNRGQAEVSLAGWAFTKGVKFTFPTGAKLSPGGFLVVCRNKTSFAARYGAEIPVAGNFEGKLSRKGDHLELINAQKQIIDFVKYADSGDWPRGADGHSASLERICPSAPGDQPLNWAASKLPRTQRPAGTPGKQNDNFSANLPPAITKLELSPTNPPPQKKFTVSASVADADGVQAASVFYRVMAAGSSPAEKEIPMKRAGGDEKSGVYQAELEGVPADRLVRYRIKATDATGASRFHPNENEPRPSFSFGTFANTNNAQIAFGHVMNVAEGEAGAPASRSRSRRQMGGYGPAKPAVAKPNGAFIYMPPGGGPVQVFDHVRISPRKGGFKVRFPKDQPLNGMTGLNLIYEGAPRWVLAEPLAYEMYRLAGVPAEKWEHLRLFVDGQFQGYHLGIEQPNKNFLTRHYKDNSGNLYKQLWYGDGVVEKHEKKTNLETGHDDIVKVIEGLNNTRGAAQWEFIQKNFDLEKMASYFAVNMCIQNWDGFFNNYYAYHDTVGTGKWSMIPWDEDKTWGDFDGAWLPFDWYEMPLTYGMNGDRSPSGRFGRFGGGPWGGASWWRPAGYFSGPMLANAEFRKKFLARLGELCETTFTQEKLFPIIDAMEKRLALEIRLRAEKFRENPEESLTVFKGNMQSFRNQVVNRRKFIQAELRKQRANGAAQ